MADDLRHPQPAETLPLRMEPPEGLKTLAQPTPSLSQTDWPASNAQYPAPRERPSAKMRPRGLISDGLLAPPTIQMYPGQKLTVLIRRPHYFERYFLDYQSGQLTLAPDVTSSLVN